MSQLPVSHRGPHTTLRARSGTLGHMVPLWILVFQLAPPMGHAASAQAVFNGIHGQVSVTPPRIEQAVEVDGHLSEPPWEASAVLTSFSQYLPVDGRASEDPTEVLVWYSPTGIYFGIRAFEEHGVPHATLADRDQIEGDDYLQIFIDTFNDRRQALVFGVNPLGVQSDGIRNEVETAPARRGAPQRPMGVDLTPDFVYESEGRITPFGFEIELFIPFKSISYQATEPQNWGINILRKVQHSGHTDTWTPAVRGNASFLAQAGQLVGLHGLRRGVVVDFTPVVTSSLEGARPEGGGNWRYGRPDPEMGGNLRVGFSANLTFDGTVNPDFSQVEADVGQITSNERFALFYPEKRPFFLEGIDRFETPNRLIHTRRLVDPLAGAKLTGKVAGTNIGVLSAVDDDGVSPTGDRYPVVNLVRLRRDFGRQSTIGVVYTDRVTGSDFNRVAAADARLVFADLYALQFQAGGSFTRTEGEVTGAPLWEASFSRVGRRLGLNYRLTGIHPDFKAESGYVPRPGVISTTVSNSLTFYGSRGFWVESWTTAVRFLGWWDYHGIRDELPVESKTFFSNSFVFRGGWRGSINYGWETYAFDPDKYVAYGLERPSGSGTDTIPFIPPARIDDVNGVIVRMTTPEFTSFSATLGVNLWKDVGFVEARAVNLLRTNADLNWRPTDQLRINLRYDHLRLDRRVDRSNLSDQGIPRLKIEYQISRSVFVRMVGQVDANHQAALRDPRTEEPILLYDSDTDRYVESKEWERNDLRWDFLFSYRPNPGTVIFAGYGSSLTGPEADGFFMKLSYLFRR